MMVKLKSLVVPMVIYPYTVVFSFEQTDSQLEQVLNKHGLQYHNGMSLNGAGKFFIVQDELFCLVRLRYYPDNVNDIGTLAHEVLHAVAQTFNDMGLCLNEGSEEAYTYMMGYLIREVYKNL